MTEDSCRNESGSLKICKTLTDIIIDNTKQEFGLKKVNGNGTLDAVVYRMTNGSLISVYVCPFCGGSLKR
jgi:hypothetical protein